MRPLSVSFLTIKMLFFLSFANSYEIKCESELKHAPPVEGAELAWVGVVTRHGVRTPMDSWTPKNVSGDWHCDGESAYSPRMHVAVSNGYRRRYHRILNPDNVPYLPNCENGELILRGMEQHQELGEFYRKWLVDEVKFLKPWLDKSQVSIRSSKVERCQRSAVSFMNGFYPPATPGEKLEFVTGSDYREPFSPGTSTCKDMENLWNTFVETEEFQKRMEESKKLYADIYKNISLEPDTTNWMFIGDWMSSYLCTGQDVPMVQLTEELITRGLEDIAYYSYGYFNTNRAVASSAIWRSIFRDIDAYLAQKPSASKFRLYSTHDTTIIALLVSLGYSDNRLPPFRSHFAIEIWRKQSKYYIRNVFNGNPVPIDFMDGENFVDFSKLKTKFSERGDLGYCLEEFPLK